MERVMKKIMVGVLSLILVVAIAFATAYQYFPFWLYDNSLNIGLHTDFKPDTNIKGVLFGAKKDIHVSQNVDTSKIGNYEVIYTFRKKMEKVKVHVKDLKAPRLKLKKYKTDMVEMMNTDMFVASCKDDSKYKISILTKDLTREGTHVVRIQAKDMYGNKVVKTTTLQRVKDQTKPTIQKVSSFIVNAGDSFDFEKAITYSDDIDPTPTMEYDTSKVNLNVAGTYPVTYTVTDRSKNKISKTIDLVVKAVPVQEGKVVYLTFDDGPSANTKKILDILDTYDAKATFFVTGRNQGYSDYIKEADAKGHAIGLHTYTHDYASVYSSIDAYFDDLNMLSQYVEKLIGKKPTAIRFPGGSSNTVSANYAKGIMTKLTSMVLDKGYQYYDWNCDSTDASGNNVDASILIENATSSHANQINLLCHDTDAKGTTVEALPKIIEYYKNKGYCFKAITQDSFVCHHGINN